MVPPCINKFYILDLQPENSFVRYALEQGHTVFLVSWRNIDASVGHLSWDDYLEQGVMQAIDVAREHHGRRPGEHAWLLRRRHAAGIVAGGTAARGEHAVSSMTLLTTMLDFTDTGEIGSLVTEQSVVARAKRRSATAACMRGQRARVCVLLAARQRPDLAIRRQQLPEGQGAAGVRSAVLERGRHQSARADVLLVRPQHVPGEQLARAGQVRSSAARR